MEKNIIYKPLSEYKTNLKLKHEENVDQLFDALIEESKVDWEANRSTIKKLRVDEAQSKYLMSSLKKQKLLRAFLIFLTVLFILAPIIFILYQVFSQSSWSFSQLGLALLIIGMILAVAGAALFIWLIVTKVNKKIETIKGDLNAVNKKIDKLTETAWNQTKDLNNLFDWTIPARLVEKTIPIVKMDPYFNFQRYDELINKYNLEDKTKNETSLFVQSGEIEGNPFVLAKNLKYFPSQKDYSGSIVVSWTEEETDSDGKTHTIVHSETLTAWVTKFFPDYELDESIIYGNEAIPNLQFSRKPQAVSNLGEGKRYEKAIDRKVKKLEKMSRKAIKQGDDFNVMNNTEFEALFHAIDRNDEQEFRLMFPALAQEAMKEILLDQTVGYGDDFYFFKDRMLNIITPEHLQRMDMNTNPKKYITYEIDQTKELFTNYNNEYFKHFYFAMAPILAIPLYQDYKSSDHIYGFDYDAPISPWEHESIAYSLGLDNLKHPLSITENILKAEVLEREKGYEKLSIKASGFQGIERIDYVWMMDSNGSSHAVPVPWVEYLPVKKETPVMVKTLSDYTRPKFLTNMEQNNDWKKYFEGYHLSNNNLLFYKNLVAFIVGEKQQDLEPKSLDDIFRNSL
ncbi:hypothetical protein ELUMI_v1c01870 [Williamsoniiplasma luminosum]|uniref:Uncharacterized protein n=1 Tax=Williamsoniiplasma luminosum TaxID=214888 RepID=A0A2K8NST5_9MOLU|nr:hypothetical protein [Williamsoniiplasma luminosum]ATZ16912.1 hypothetical protein ELUMI_v1c01870 [Williamsoniiplasma luminosum]